MNASACVYVLLCTRMVVSASPMTRGNASRKDSISGILKEVEEALKKKCVTQELVDPPRPPPPPPDGTEVSRK